MLKARQELEDTTQSAVNLVADELMTQVKKNSEEVKEEDIDDLLGWTNALNFDE